MIRSVAYVLVGLGSLLAGATAIAADSALESTASNTTKDQPNAQPLIENLGAKSDRELTALTAQWGQLSSTERRILLAEVRNRMHLRKVSQAKPKVRVTRRYGRIVRKPDGSVVVQTQIVTPATQDSPEVVRNGQRVVTQNQVRRQGRITFGFGFERRGARKTPDTSTQRDAGTTSEVAQSTQPELSENTSHPSVKAE